MGSRVNRAGRACKHLGLLTVAVRAADNDRSGSRTLGWDMGWDDSSRPGERDGANARPILVAGLPRGGTTWFGRVLASAPGTVYVHEPDTRETAPYARAGLHGQWQDPNPAALARGVPAYDRLWRVAFAGGWGDGVFRRGITHVSVSRRMPARVARTMQSALTRHAERHPRGGRAVVKTVYAYYSLEWIADRFDPAIAIVWRSPLNMLPSWLELGWFPHPVRDRRPVRERFEGTAAWPPPEDLGVERIVWTSCAHLTVMLETAARYPAWHVSSHEALCMDPVRGFKEVFDAVGLPWSEEVETYLAAHDRAGTGFSESRVASDEPEAWKRRLTPAQRDAALRVVESFAPEWPAGSALGRWAAGLPAAVAR